MKIALVHDWLHQKAGGGEAVLFEMAELFPQADIFTLIYNKRLFGQHLRGRKIKTSFLQKFPKRIKTHPEYLLPFIKKAVESFDFSDYDIILTSSSAWVKNIKKPEGAVHICYCHSPARMLWDSWPGYLYQKNKTAMTKFLAIRTCSKLRLWDFYKSQDIDVLLANSRYVAGRIAKFYRLKSTVVYPPVVVGEALKNQPKGDYYIVLSVLSRYKKIDLAIRSFIANSRKLIIVGDGPDRARLKEIAKDAPNIQFYGRVSDNEKWRLLAGARALIFPSIEDFGITPVEAMASATPVIARRGGGLNETVIDKKTGVFFEGDSEAQLTQAVQKVEKLRFSTSELIGQAKKYDRTDFIFKLKEVVGKSGSK